MNVEKVLCSRTSSTSSFDHLPVLGQLLANRAKLLTYDHLRAVNVDCVALEIIRFFPFGVLVLADIDREFRALPKRHRVPPELLVVVAELLEFSLVASLNST